MLILPWKFLFILLLILGSVIAMSAPSWFMAWVGLEINTVAVLAILMDNKSPRNSEAAMKYFLIQALASSLLVISAFFTPSLMFSENYISWSVAFIFLSLMVKIGSAPFHFWLPQVVSGLSWANCFLILVWQKVAPFILCVWCLYNPTVNSALNFFILSSALVGALGGLVQTSTNKILAFSSINHLGWLMMALKISFSVWMLYFTVYSTLIFILLTQLYKMNMLSLSSTSAIIHEEKMSFTTNLLSFGGLPPFLGFIPKWMVVMLSANHFGALTLLLIFSSLVTLFFYLRLSFNFMFRKASMPLAASHSKSMHSLSSAFMMNLMGLMLFMSVMFQL